MHKERININDLIKFDLSECEIKSIIKSVLKKLDISKMDNLRGRHPNVQFDCLLRGYVGEYCMTKWLESHAIYFEATNFIQDNESIDIDFYYKKRNIELKTSLVPDADKSINTAIQKRDIKLIRRGHKTIEALRGDIHLQIYFAQKRKAKDDWLRNQKINLAEKNVGYLYDAFKAIAYKNTTYFVAWIDKETLVRQINQLRKEKRCWSFKGAKRDFWNCKIQTARKPNNLIPYLKSLS